MDESFDLVLGFITLTTFWGGMYLSSRYKIRKVRAYLRKLREE